ncbi:MAG: tetratricopeptide repeat protein [Nostocales cyanobacterium 94392]|nr:tetratricopeptide repeat protein [Nostocales cyanobacterium 94392]
MSSESLEIAKQRYRNGKTAFENGKYRQAVEELEKACALLARNTRLGGEVQIWLATAYEAAGRNQDAIDLCEQLKRHPYPDTSKEAKRLQYILKAPKLERPKEWMTEIPDLGSLSDNESKMRLAASVKKSPAAKEPLEPELIDLSQVNTQDNRFIWLTLIIIVVTLGSLIWLSF